jgi:choline dehydrogenase-like flavoprotein
MAMTQSQDAQTSPEGPQASASAGWLTATERRTLEAICDALIPAVPAPVGADDLGGYYARTAREMGVAMMMAETLGQESPETRNQFKQLLGLLGSSAGGLLLAGRPKGLADLPLDARQRALRRMSLSALPTLRQGFSALKRLAHFIYYAAPAENGLNPNWSTIGYTPAPPPPSSESAPKPIHPLPVEKDLELTADAVVVGSGAGGGLIAARLAAAGKDVIIVEKGGYYNESDFNGSEVLMTPALYLRRGTLATSDLGMIVLAGSTLGGGTVVNWSTSLRTPPDVLAEWEREHGLTGVTSPEYQRGFDFAEQRLGVNTDDSDPNPNNAALMRGCRTLGYDWKRIPRNASGCEQRCGACGYGCPYGRKQSTTLTFIQDAHDKGARVIVRCQVERALVSSSQVTGVEGWARDEKTSALHRITINAPIVVVAGGAVESPALLIRSGLRTPNTGAHLRLHPVVALASYYEDKIEPWRGSLQTVLTDHFKSLRGPYGLRFECAPAHPGMLGMVTPWENGAQHKRDMARIPYVATFIALMRDTGEGRVTLDRQGDPVLHYFPNETDRRFLAQAMSEMARIAAAGGATRIATLHNRRMELDAEAGQPGAFTPQRIEEFAREVERRGIAPNTVPVFSAHQMGTCRLGSSAKTAVADPAGQVFGVKGLYIGDASGFPTASGVNPMLSIMALAYRVADGILAAS